MLPLAHGFLAPDSGSLTWKPGSWSSPHLSTLVSMAGSGRVLGGEEVRRNSFFKDHLFRSVFCTPAWGGWRVQVAVAGIRYNVHRHHCARPPWPGYWTAASLPGDVRIPCSAQGHEQSSILQRSILKAPRAPLLRTRSLGSSANTFGVAPPLQHSLGITKS